jgi:response regulator RpfG family c-di-GMP phosphodiesterase
MRTISHKKSGGDEPGVRHGASHSSSGADSACRLQRVNGEGSTLTTPRTPIEHTSEPQGPRVEILTVCSNRLDWVQLRAMMVHTNWRSYCVTTVSCALSVMRAQVIPIVLCATQLPDGTWKDILAAARKATDSARVIVFTEQADESLWSEIIAAGAHDVLTKPFDRSDLNEVVSLAYRQWLRARGRKLSLSQR